MSSELTIPVEDGLFANRYKPVRLLGKGGMGEVYLVQDTMLENEEVALKLLKREFSEDDVYISRFLREVKLARQVTHPSVVRTYDVGQSDGILYLTMEYVVGESIKDFLKRDSLIHYSQVAKYIPPLCEGLHEIHKHEIIHRDLKPANILLIEGGGVKITDFGIARPGNSELTHHDEIVGSTHYLAPEIWLGKELSSATDIYALGVVLYEMLTGNTPFEAENPAELMWKHLEAHPLAPSSIEPSVPLWMDELVLALMSKEHDQRPCNALEISDYILRLSAEEELRQTGDYLAPILDDEPVAVPPEEITQQGVAQESLLTGNPSIQQPAADLRGSGIDIEPPTQSPPLESSVLETQIMTRDDNWGLYFLGLRDRGLRLTVAVLGAIVSLALFSELLPVLSRLVYFSTLKLTSSSVLADTLRGMVVLSGLIVFALVPFFLIHIQTNSLRRAAEDCLRAFGVLSGCVALLFTAKYFSVPSFSMQVFIKEGVNPLIAISTLSPEVLFSAGLSLHSFELYALLGSVCLYACTLLKAVERSFTHSQNLFSGAVVFRALGLVVILSLSSLLIWAVGGHQLVSPHKAFFLSFANYSFQIKTVVVSSALISIFLLLVLSLFIPAAQIQPKSRRENRPTIQ